MKILLLLLLGASLVTNAVLLNRRFSTPADTVAPVAAATAKSAHPSAPGPAVSEATWARIKAGDPAGVEQLRATGLPDFAVRALVRAEIEAQFLERQKSLYLAPSEVNYWERSFSFARWAPKDRTALIDLDREKNALLDKLLGPDSDRDPRRNVFFAHLPSDKAEHAALIAADYDAMEQNIRQFDTVVFPEDKEKLAYLQKEKRAELAQLLTPQELEEYELRASSTASLLRFQLSAFNPTQAEFRTLFALQKPFDEKFSLAGGMASNAPEDIKARQEAQVALDKQIGEVLGEKRFAEYQRAKDSDYRTLSSLTSRLNLPPEKAIEAYNVKTSLEKKLREIRPEPGVDGRRFREEAQAKLLAEAETEFTKVLGPKGYETYKEYGQIFRRLQPQPARPAP